MKTTAYLKNVFIFFFILLLNCVVLFAQDKYPDHDSLVCLEVSGKIRLQNNPYNNKIKVELIHYNTVIDSITVKQDKKFKFYFEKGAYYTLRISKPGYITKLITVCTILKKFNHKDDYYRFQFDTELLPVIATEILDQEVLEFPIAIISFDEKLKAFFINENYTSNIKKESFFK